MGVKLFYSGSGTFSTHISTKNVISLNIGLCYVPTITIRATIEIVVLIVE